MTPKDLAALACAVYNQKSGGFTNIFDVNGVYCGLNIENDVKVIACRGSANAKDWFRDFKAEPLTVPLVGTVHAGMWEVVQDMYESLALKAGDTVTLSGHSLGCAHAAYLAKLCLNDGIKVDQLFMLAPPRMGYADFHDGLAGIPTNAYHNHGDILGDPVPCVPVPMDEMPWEQFPLIMVTEPPAGLDEFDPFCWHGSDLYFRGMPA